MKIYTTFGNLTRLALFSFVFGLALGAALFGVSGVGA